MKNRDLIKLIDAFLDAPNSDLSENYQRELSEICRILKKSPAAETETAIKSKTGKKDNKSSSTSSILLQILTVAGVFATSAKKRDIKKLVSVLRDSECMSLNDFISRIQNEFAPTSSEIVNMYVEQLRETFRDKKQFNIVFQELKSDKRVKLPEALEIARLFANFNRKATKAKALEQIYNIHKYYADSADISRRLQGQSAA